MNLVFSEIDYDKVPESEAESLLELSVGNRGGSVDEEGML